MESIKGDKFKYEYYLISETSVEFSDKDRVREFKFDKISNSSNDGFIIYDLIVFLKILCWFCSLFLFMNDLSSTAIARE